MPKIDYFSNESLRQDLKGRTVRGGALTGAAQAAKVVISLATIPLLARLLDPEDFGLVAIVTVFTGFASMFVDAGLSTATVQRGTITQQQVSNLFWIATALGLGIGLIVSAAAPAIGWLYEEPRLVPITIALAGSFVLSGLTVQHQALLRRGMQFRELAIADFVSQVVAQVAGVAWAWSFSGQPNDYWALVLVPIVAAGIRMALTCGMCRWRPSAPTAGAGTRELVVFGADLTGGGVINYFARNADKALIGWYWGEAALGYYANAYRLLLFPLTAINGPISNVAIPALSRLKDQPEAYRNFFRRGVGLASLLLVPAVVSSITLAEPLVLTVLGEEWAPSVPLFLALAPAALAQTTAPASVWVYQSWGHTRLWLKLVVFNTITVLLGLAIALPFGVFWVAMSFSICVCLIRIPNIVLLFRPTPLRLSDLFAPMGLPALASAIAGTIVELALHFEFVSNSAGLTLVSGLALFALSYAAVVLSNASSRSSITQLLLLLRQRSTANNT